MYGASSQLLYFWNLEEQRSGREVLKSSYRDGGQTNRRRLVFMKGDSSIHHDNIFSFVTQQRYQYIKHNCSEGYQRRRLSLSPMATILGQIIYLKPSLSAFIRCGGLALCFVDLSANWLDNFIHLISLISFVEMYSFNAAMSIHKRFSLTFVDDLNASKSD